MNERQRQRDSETNSNRDPDDTQVAEDVPPLATSVRTLQEAVQLSLLHGINENCLFTFARALKAFEITTDRRLSARDLDGAFSLWWGTAASQLPDDADFDEYRLDFQDKFSVTRAALGSNSLEEAARRSDSSPLPPQAERYRSPKIRRLVAVCYHLQVLQGTSPFFLSTRDAARISGANGGMQASSWLAGLVLDGVLVQVEKGTRRRATRFRFNAPEFFPDASDIDSSESENSISGNSLQRKKKTTNPSAK